MRAWVSKFLFLLLKARDYVFFSQASIIQKYIYKEVFQPFIVAFIFFVSLFLTSALRNNLGELFSKKIPIVHIAYFLFNIIIEQIPNAIPPVTLFASILAANRLSNDHELTALRAVGFSELRIYSIFFKIGIFLCAIYAIFCFFISPMQINKRRTFTEWLATYQSIAFLKPGSFFNKENSGGEQTDVYVVRKKGKILQDLYIHNWNIDMSKEGNITEWDDKPVNIGQSQTKQIIFARTGELIARKESSIKNETTENIEKNIYTLPPFLRNKSLFDLSFLFSISIDTNSKEKKFLRLEKGYMIEFKDEGTKGTSYSITDFRNGLLDFTLKPAPRGIGYISIAQIALSITQMYHFLTHIDKGGLIFDPSLMQGLGQGSKINYIELPSALRTKEIEKNIKEISSLSNVEVSKKYNFYIPANVKTSEERMRHIQWVLSITNDLAAHKIEFLYFLNRRISSTLGIILFTLIAFPLGVMNKRSGRGSSFVTALIIYAIYSSLALYENSQMYKKINLPILRAWLPDGVMLLMMCVILNLPKEGYTQLRLKFGIKLWNYFR